MLKSLLKRLAWSYADQREKAIVTKHAQRCSYSLPAYVISYPRSGSNFLQSVLERSSRLRCKSIYSLPHESPGEILSLKSHALSYEYLLDEVERLVPGSDLPDKFIFLFRDPRDVMVSFYEFIQARKNIQIPQSDFLNKMCFFYATFVNKDKILERKVELEPLSVVGGYKKHVRNWFVERPQSLGCLIVRFEDLVQCPDEEFQRIFDFLELGCSLARDALNLIVSQYSTSGRQRGVPYGWQLCEDKYSELLRTVNASLYPEIRVLGYDE